MDRKRKVTILFQLLMQSSRKRRKMDEEAWGDMYSSLQSDGSKVVVNAGDDEQDEIGC